MCSRRCKYLKTKNDEFTLNQRMNGKMKRIILYGDNPLARRSVVGLKDAGIDVCAILDRRYLKDKEKNDILYLNPQDVEVKELASESSVIICLGDASKHDEIAEMLFEIGFKRILYLSTDKRITVEKRSYLRCLYAIFTSGNYKQLVIPNYEKVVDTNEMIFPLIRKDWCEVVFWCSERFLY